MQEFYEAAGNEVGVPPGWPRDEVVDLQVNLLIEEFEELMRSLGVRVRVERDPATSEREPLPQVAEGLVDLVVMVVGTAIRLGIPFDACWRDVLRSKMANVALGDEGEQTMTPEDWEPDLEGVLARYSQWAAERQKERLQADRLEIGSMWANRRDGLLVEVTWIDVAPWSRTVGYRYQQKIGPNSAAMLSIPKFLSEFDPV